MAPAQSRKRKSAEADLPEDEAEVATPTGSPVRKRAKITQAQKQALIDNLQLEITQRARNLRAHYALQSSDLRSRIERRINRIPVSLRKENMGELLAKYSEAKAVKAPTAPAVPAHGTISAHAATTTTHPLPLIPGNPSSKQSSPARPPMNTNRPKSRTDKLDILSDKENESTHALTQPATTISTTLTNPKNPKRCAQPSSRATSRTAKGPSVLSPRSHNSRTLPRSPIKEHASTSPSKVPTTTQSYIARPTSPLNPASPLKAASSAILASVHGMVKSAGAAGHKLTRTASKEKAGKEGAMAPPPRPAPATSSSPRTASATSNHSASSTSATVVKKSGGRGKTTTTVSQVETKPVAAETKKKTAMKKAASATANKKVVVAEPAAGRRVLRKRD